jgi:hypothetical protein
MVKHDWESNGARRRGDRTTVTNMDLAIYCHMLHRLQKVQLPVLMVWKVDRHRREIVFSDPDDVISGMEARFINSPEAAAFAAAQRSLKSIMRERERERPIRRRAVK